MVFVVEIYERKTSKFVGFYPTFGDLPLSSLGSAIFNNAISENLIPFNANESVYRFVIKGKYSPLCN